MVPKTSFESCEARGAKVVKFMNENATSPVGVSENLESNLPPSAQDVGIAKLTDGSGFFTATILSNDEIAALPSIKRPLSHRISSEIYHAVWQSIGEASMQWIPRPTGVFDSSGASKIAVELCLKIADEISKIKK